LSISGVLSPLHNSFLLSLKSLSTPALSFLFSQASAKSYLHPRLESRHAKQTFSKGRHIMTVNNPDPQIPDSTYELEMGRTEFIAFNTNGFRSVITRQLNGCSVAMLISSHGPIIAHIPPLPIGHDRPLPLDISWDLMDSLDPVAGDRQMQDVMDYFASLYDRHRDSFPPERVAITVHALYAGRIALPEQMNIMHRAFQMMGFTPVSIFYSVLRPGDARSPKKGIVFIDGRGPSPIVHVEDLVVLCDQIVRPVTHHDSCRY
jgi:hypothetical protein